MLHYKEANRKSLNDTSMLCVRFAPFYLCPLLKIPLMISGTLHKQADRTMHLTELTSTNMKHTHCRCYCTLYFYTF